MNMEMSRFLLAGGVNFVFTFLVFTGALKVMHTGYVAALLLAWISGNILTYVLNFVWVFRPEDRLSFGMRFFKYLTAGAFSIAANLMALSALVEIGGFDPFWAQLIVMPFIIAFNFIAAKFWSLKKAPPLP
ncbi:hypothetical protein DD563_14985 [Pelagicola sp. LXJ1103]|nr:hypothetical protein DD563_14985 [Pelagicola sp. LXJ1103]